MIPTSQQFESVKQLCSHHLRAGHLVTFKTVGDFNHQSPAITVIANRKIYKLSDPDWDVVIKQLQQI